MGWLTGIFMRGELDKTQVDLADVWIFRRTAIIGLGVIVIAIYSAISPNILKSFSLLSAISGAAFLIGSLIGFLFGIPKIRARPKDESVPTNVTKYEDNTNLEEVSDWLTKMIVGIGLVEFKKLMIILVYIGHLVANATQMDPDTGTLYGIGVTVYFTIAGFIFSYLWTRTSFHELLNLFNNRFVHLVTLNRKVSAVDTELRDINTRRVLGNYASGIATAGLERKNNGRVTSLHLLEDLDKEVVEILATSPTNRTAAILRARYVSEVLSPDNDLKGIQEAIGILETYIKSKRAAGEESGPDFTAGLYNIACYHARALRTRRLQTPQDQDAIAKEREQALLYLKDCIAALPTEAAEAIDDPDFQCLHDDPEFRTLTKLPAQP